MVIIFLHKHGVPIATNSYKSKQKKNFFFLCRQLWYVYVGKEKNIRLVGGGGCVYVCMILNTLTRVICNYHIRFGGTSQIDVFYVYIIIIIIERHGNRSRVLYIYIENMPTSETKKPTRPWERDEVEA